MMVLSNNPDYGVVVKGTNGLRKMRVNVPSLNTGKRGGYRLIYKALVIDETWTIVFLASYYKGDCDDLDSTEYKMIESEANDIFCRSEDIPWRTM
jgi:mRNA-degrading endonuclease RelE of RelBE toxin-antitoxin system